MTNSPVPIGRLPTGVPGLDIILGGGIPELSFNLIAGGPGTGKTTLAHQIAFANATVARPALIFTVLGEPTLKLLRYQQQFDFFDPAAINSRIKLLNLAEEAMSDSLERVLDRIAAEVEVVKPALVVVDSFRSVIAAKSSTDRSVGRFVQMLGVHLSTWNVTSFLLGEYAAAEVHDPIFTVADGVLYLTQAIDRNSVVRKIQVIKMRGADPMPGLHTYRTSGAGLQVFPRITSEPQIRVPLDRPRMSTGVPTLDEMMGGGIPAGDAVVVAGPTGCGKTTLTTHVVRAAAEVGESVVLVVFEELPRTYVQRARRLIDLDAMVESGKLEIIYLRPLDLSVDETLHAIREAVRRVGASRVVIDSLSGFEVALAPTFREDFAESLYRLVGTMIGLGVTVVMTVETIARAGGVQFKNDAVSFLTDDIILMRFIELDGQMRTVVGVLKMRGSTHSKDLRMCDATATGFVVGEVPHGYRALTSGIPSKIDLVRIQATDDVR